MNKVFTPDWIKWLATNINSGQNKDGLFKILLDEGFAFNDIVTQMNYQPSVDEDKLVNPFIIAGGQQKMNEVKGNNQSIQLPNQSIFMPNSMQFNSDKLELYAIENFLNEEECRKIINLLTSKLRPSELTTAEADKSYRTSRTCDLGQLNDPFMANIDSRICKMIGIDSSYSEVFQGQYYEVGQQFKAHTDFFEKHEMATFGGKMGQRTYTFMIYLNDVEEGGETNFVNVKESIKPQRGMAVIWNSLYPNGATNSHSTHHGMPVIKGYKAIITKWFRSYNGLDNSVSMFSKSKNEYVPNFTESGVNKATLPAALFKKITAFYQNNKASKVDEHVPGDFIINAEDKSNNKTNKKSSQLIDLSEELRKEIHDTMKPILEKWCQQSLKPTYVYGIREYLDKAVLKPHRDRVETHIISAILNVDQEVNEDWPLVIEDNYYRTHHVMLKPGEMVFYEGARLLHGRPIPLNGKSFANIFCHFQPIKKE